MRGRFSARIRTSVIGGELQVAYHLAVATRVLKEGL